jgi:hypothetical protein
MGEGGEEEMAERAYVFFRLVSTTLDPEQISERVGFPPDEAGRMGERQGRSLLVRRVHSWTLHAPRLGSEAVSEMVDTVLQRACERADEIRGLVQSGAGRATLQFALYSATPAGLALSGAQLQLVASLGAGLDVDTYWTTEEP